MKSLLEKANLEVAAYPHIYRTEEDYQNLLNNFRRQNKQLVFNHVHRLNEVDQKAYWIKPELVAFLNNKANLDKIVPPGYVPKRATIPSSEIKDVTYKVMKLPLVIKAATNQSTGAGYDVKICRNLQDINQAYNFFSICETVVVEELINIHKIYNTQFARTIDGQIIYLGTSEQISTSSGSYLGNWIISNNDPPKSVVELGRSIIEYACRLGFFGIGGFDIVLSDDNRVLAIDLNFRLNGSTPALLLRDSIMRNNDASVLLFRTWRANIEWTRFLSICREFIESKYLIPISIYNPLSSLYSNSDLLFSGVLTGSSRQDILHKECILARTGLK